MQATRYKLVCTNAYDLAEELFNNPVVLCLTAYMFITHKLAQFAAKGGPGHFSLIQKCQFFYWSYPFTFMVNRMSNLLFSEHEAITESPFQFTFFNPCKIGQRHPYWLYMRQTTWITERDRLQSNIKFLLGEIIAKVHEIETAQMNLDYMEDLQQRRLIAEPQLFLPRPPVLFQSLTKRHLILAAAKKIGGPLDVGDVAAYVHQYYPEERFHPVSLKKALRKMVTRGELQVLRRGRPGPKPKRTNLYNLPVLAR
jgi:hypothetical protein